MTQEEALQELLEGSVRALAGLVRSVELALGRPPCGIEPHDPARLPFVAAGALKPDGPYLEPHVFDLQTLLEDKPLTRGHILNRGLNPLRVRLEGMDRRTLDVDVVPGEKLELNFIIRNITIYLVPELGPTEYRVWAE